MCLLCQTQQELERRLANPLLPPGERQRVQETLNGLEQQAEQQAERGRETVPEVVRVALKELMQAAREGRLTIQPVTLKDNGEPTFLLSASWVVPDTNDPAGIWHKTLPLAIMPPGGPSEIRALVQLEDGFRDEPPSSGDSPAQWPEYRIGG